jgi:hypothetical protein
LNDRQSAQLRQFDKGLVDAKAELGRQQERAEKLESANITLRADLENAQAESRNAESRLAQEQRKTAEAQAELEGEQQKTAKAQEESAKAQLALKKYVSTVADRQRAREVDKAKLLAMLEGKPKSSIVLLYNPNDSEAYWLSFMLFTWLGKGNPDSPGAGWDVTAPRPIPPNVGFLGGHPPDAPAAMRFGGVFTSFGITFVVNNATLATSAHIGSSFQSFTDAIGRSITPRPTPDGYSFVYDGDNSIPDGVIWLVVGPKPPVMFPDNPDR